MEINKIYEIFLESEGICTDTRQIKQNQLFIALNGENFDGNKYAKYALDNGAKYCIIDNKDYYIDNRTIIVDNALQTLQLLANYHRNSIDAKIIAITGTNGKTTSKELLYSVLKQNYNVYATEGNLNNHIGVPLTLLNIKNNHEIAIIEMGANHMLEIKTLCEIAEPNYGVITNIGIAHLEGFGSFENIILTKTELYDFINKNNGLVFVDYNDTLLVEKSKNINCEYYNKKDNIIVLKSNPLQIIYNNIEIFSNLYGNYNLNNILMALKIGEYFEIQNDNLKNGIENYFPKNKRSQLIEYDNNKYIMDCYNANPTSLNLAIENLMSYEDKKFFIIGDMLELGEYSYIEHKKILDKIKNYNNIEGIFVGEEFQKIKIDNYFWAKNIEEAKSIFAKIKLENNIILIKGSRGIKLEKIFEGKIL